MIYELCFKLKFKFMGNIEKICGIYCISNSKYFYVGHSVSIYQRWDKHRRELRRGNHINLIMQNVYNKYQELDPFKYEIVKEVSFSKLQIEEGNVLLEYIYKFPEKKCMNIANPISELKHFVRKDHKLIKIEKELAEPLKKGNFTCTKIGERPWKRKKIVQLDKKGNLIKVWESISKAEKALGIRYQKKNKLCGGFQWQLYEDWVKNPKREVNHIHNIDDPVKQYDLDKKYIAEWKNAKIASQFTKVDYGGIIACLNGKQKTAGGFLWSHTQISPNSKINKNRHNTPKTVYKIDKYGKVVTIYKSIIQAAKSLNITATTLNKYLNKNTIYKGYIWKLQK